VKFLGATNCVMANITAWDGSGMLNTDHTFYVSRGNGDVDGGYSHSITIMNCQITDSQTSYDTGKVFIKANSVQNLIIMGCGSVSSSGGGYLYCDVGSSRGQILGSYTLGHYSGSNINYVPYLKPPALGSTVDDLITWMTPPA
jgi:hypothetical protein